VGEGGEGKGGVGWRGWGVRVSDGGIEVGREEGGGNRGYCEEVRVREGRGGGGGVG